MVALLAFIPVILASVAPTSWKTPLVAVSGVLVIAALAMRLRRDRALRADEDGRRPMNDGDMSSAT